LHVQKWTQVDITRILILNKTCTGYYGMRAKLIRVKGILTYLLTHDEIERMYGNSFIY
jgi:hypothetical protein